MVTKQQILRRFSAITEGYAPYKVQESFKGLLVTCIVLLVAIVLYGTYSFPMAVVIGVGLGASAMIILKIAQAAYTVIKYLIKGNQ